MNVQTKLFAKLLALALLMSPCALAQTPAPATTTPTAADTTSLLASLPALPTKHVRTLTWFDPGAFTTTPLSDTEHLARITGAIGFSDEHSSEDQVQKTVALAKAHNYTLCVITTRGPRDKYDPMDGNALLADLTRLTKTINRVKAFDHDNVAFILDWEHHVVDSTNRERIRKLFLYARWSIRSQLPGAMIEHYGFGEHPAETVTGWKPYNWYISDITNQQSTSLYYGEDDGLHGAIVARHHSPLTAWISVAGYYVKHPDKWGRVFKRRPYDLGAVYQLFRKIYHPWFRVREDRFLPFNRITVVILYPIDGPGVIAAIAAAAHGATD